MTDYLDQVQAEVKALVGFKMKGEQIDIPFYDQASLDYRPVGDERVVGLLNGVQRLEVRNTGRTFRAEGFWATVARGFLGRRSASAIMGSPKRAAENEQRATAHGRLIVTDQALAFEGDTKSERMTWQQVANVGLLTDGITISKRSGPSRTYLFTELDPKFTAVLLIMSKGRAVA